MNAKYQPIKDSDRWTIGICQSKNTVIINDGINCFYWWNSKAEAQEAADALNDPDCPNHSLGDHGYGYDRINADDVTDWDDPVIELHRLLHAIDGYHIDFGTGVGNFEIIDSLEEAQAAADEGASYTGQPIIIRDAGDDEVCRRQWYGTAYDPSEAEQDNPIIFGNYGFYSDWKLG